MLCRGVQKTRVKVVGHRVIQNPRLTHQLYISIEAIDDCQSSKCTPVWRKCSNIGLDELKRTKFHCVAHKKTATIATMHKSCGSLQVCASGFKVCKTKQTYIIMSHSLVSNYAPPKKWFTTKRTYKPQDLRVMVTQTLTLSTELLPFIVHIFTWVIIRKHQHDCPNISGTINHKPRTKTLNPKLPPKQPLDLLAKKIKTLCGTSRPPLILKQLQRKLYKGNPKPTTTRHACWTLLL